MKQFWRNKGAFLKHFGKRLWKKSEEIKEIATSLISAMSPRWVSQAKSASTYLNKHGMCNNIWQLAMVSAFWTADASQKKWRWTNPWPPWAPLTQTRPVLMDAAGPQLLRTPAEAPALPRNKRPPATTWLIKKPPGAQAVEKLTEPNPFKITGQRARMGQGQQRALPSRIAEIFDKMECP